MLHIDLHSVVGCFDSGQLEDVVTVTTAATYSEELAICFEHAKGEQALSELFKVCCNILRTIEQVASCDSKQRQAHTRRRIREREIRLS